MLRLSKLGDYGTVLMAHLARQPEQARTAPQISEGLGMPLPTVSKLLKALTRAGLLCSERGVKGGYRLARAPAEISLADVVQAVDGPLAVTDCADGKGCERAQDCAARPHWQRVNRMIHEALAGIKLAAVARGPS